MIDPSSISTPLAGFAAGLVTSIHCVGMCGPLVCALLPRNQASASSAQASLAIYHGARMISYATIGAVAGALGGAVGHLFSFGFVKALPWAFVAVFLVFLFGWEKKLPKIPVLSALFFRLRLKAATIKRPVLSLLLGAFTPFLPCAPLYLLFGVSLLTGSALAGGLMMAAFALGTIAPLWLLQSQFVRLQKRFSPRTIRRVQQGLAVVSILLIAWRVLATGEASLETAIPVPSCCTF